MAYFRSAKQLVLYALVVLILTLIFWKLFPLFGVTNFSDQLALVQVFLNIFLLIPSLLALIVQIRSSQTTPKLDIEIRTHSAIADQHTIFIPNQGEHIQELQISLMNDGDAVSLWYIVRIFIPKDLIDSKENVDIRPIVGTIPENWKPSFLNNDYSGDFLLTFLSNGEFASYPKDGLILVQLKIKVRKNKHYDSVYKIRYFIVSEKGSPHKEGVCTLKLSQL